MNTILIDNNWVDASLMTQSNGILYIICGGDTKGKLFKVTIKPQLLIEYISDGWKNATSMVADKN